MLHPTETTPPPPATTNTTTDSDKRIGRDISFGIQQTLACWATDFIDPVVGKWFQTKYGDHKHEVTHKHVWGGEIAGDSAAFFAYMFIKQAFRRPVDALTLQVKDNFDPLIEKMGKKSLKNWSRSEHLTPEDPEYKRKLDEYKQFQAENMVDSGIIAASSTVLNVGMQRALGNKQGLGLILASKLIGATATIGTMLGLRSAVPTTMKSLDDELSERYFSRIVRTTQRMFGVAPTKDAAAPEQRHIIAPLWDSVFTDAPIVTEKLADAKLTAFVRMVAQHSGDTHFEDAAAAKQFLAQEKAWLVALAESFSPDSAFAKSLADKHYAIIQRLHGFECADIDLGTPEALRAVSTESIQSILVNRRDDLNSLIKTMHDPKFLDAVKAERAHPTVAETGLSEEKKAGLVETLLQAATLKRGQPAVHIYANAKGQVIEHEALAHCFDPEGSVTGQLVKEMQSQLPDQDAAKVAAMTKNYMAERQLSAIRTVEHFSLSGDIVSDAIARSERLRTRHASEPQQSMAI